MVQKEIIDEVTGQAMLVEEEQGELWLLRKVCAKEFFGLEMRLVFRFLWKILFSPLPTFCVVFCRY